MQDPPSTATTVPPRSPYFYNGLALTGLPGHVAGSASNNAPSSREQEMRDVPPAPTNEGNTTAAVPQASSFAFGQSHAAPPSFSLGYGQTFVTPPFGSFTGFSNLNRPAQGESSRNVPQTDKVNYNYPPVGGSASTSQSHFDKNGNPRSVPQVNAPPPPQAPNASVPHESSPAPSQRTRGNVRPRSGFGNTHSAAPPMYNTPWIFTSPRFSEISAHSLPPDNRHRRQPLENRVPVPTSVLSWILDRLLPRTLVDPLPLPLYDMHMRR